jgi:integrase
VTVRHDLHALSLLFQYGRKHNWCKANVVDEVEIPSDSEAVRMHVLTVAEEAAYFATIDIMRTEKIAKKRPAHGLDDLGDLGTLMVNQGCRPEELREMEQDAVDLGGGFLTIRGGKSKAARRILRLTAASRTVLAKRLQTPGRWVFPSRRKPAAHIGKRAANARPRAEEGETPVCTLRSAAYGGDSLGRGRDRHRHHRGLVGARELAERSEVHTPVTGAPERAGGEI